MVALELSGKGARTVPPVLPVIELPDDQQLPAELVFGEAPELWRASSKDTPWGSMLSLWLVNALNQGEGAARLAPRVLEPTEQQRAAAFGRLEDRRRYVVAHVAVRVLLGARLGVTAEAVQLVREPCPSCGAPHGKPAVHGGDAHFSISRSGDVVLIGIADVPVGVDIEQVPRSDVVAELSSFLHRKEAAELAAEPDHTKAVAFARTWARKEAYLKGIGTGLSRDLARDYLGAGPRPATGPQGWALGDVAVPEGHAGAFALRTGRDGQERPARCR